DHGPPHEEAGEAHDKGGQDAHRRGEALELLVAREAEPPREEQGDAEHASTDHHRRLTPAAGESITHRFALLRICVSKLCALRSSPCKVTPANLERGVEASAGREAPPQLRRRFPE